MKWYEDDGVQVLLVVIVVAIIMVSPIIALAYAAGLL
jgi:hypothetical protein